MQTFLLVYFLLGFVYITLDALLSKYFQKKKWLAGQERIGQALSTVPDEARPFFTGLVLFIAIPLTFTIWPYGLLQGTWRALRRK
jgi:hypothetical protein